jgi:enoyl-CoA hydratase/carnithine racemase
MEYEGADMTPTEARALADKLDDPMTEWEADVFNALRSLADQVEALQVSARQHRRDERERCLQELQDLHTAQTVNNQNHSNDWHEAIDDAIATLREAT